jgi:hypothetical protein
LRLLYILKVCHERFGAPAQFADFLDCGACALVAVRVVQRHVGTLASELQRSFPTDAGAGAGYQHPFGDVCLNHEALEVFS